MKFKFIERVVISRTQEIEVPDEVANSPTFEFSTWLGESGEEAEVTDECETGGEVVFSCRIEA